MPFSKSSYDRDKPIIRHGEEYWVLPIELMNVLYQRLIDLAKDNKTTLTRAKAVDRFHTFYESRRIDQGHITTVSLLYTCSRPVFKINLFQATLYRREPTDEVAYWVLVDDEQKLGMVKEAAPFHRHNTPEEKEDWLDENRDRIKNRYMSQFNRDPVTVLLLV